MNPTFLAVSPPEKQSKVVKGWVRELNASVCISALPLASSVTLAKDNNGNDNNRAVVKIKRVNIYEEFKTVPGI